MNKNERLEVLIEWAHDANRTHASPKDLYNWQRNIRMYEGLKKFICDDITIEKKLIAEGVI